MHHNEYLERTVRAAQCIAYLKYWDNLCRAMPGHVKRISFSLDQLAKHTAKTWLNGTMYEPNFTEHEQKLIKAFALTGDTTIIEGLEVWHDHVTKTSIFHVIRTDSPSQKKPQSLTHCGICERKLTNGAFCQTCGSEDFEQCSRCDTIYEKTEELCPMCSGGVESIESIHEDAKLTLIPRQAYLLGVAIRCWLDSNPTDDERNTMTDTYDALRGVAPFVPSL